MNALRSTGPVAMSDEEVVRVLKQSIFAIESIAHLRGYEYLLLKDCESLRKKADQIETANKRSKLLFATRGAHHG